MRAVRRGAKGKGDGVTVGSMTREEWELLRGEPMTPDGLVLFARELGVPLVVEGHGNGVLVRPVPEAGIGAATEDALARLESTGGFTVLHPGDPVFLPATTASGLPGCVPRPAEGDGLSRGHARTTLPAGRLPHAGTLRPEPVDLDMNLAGFVGGTGRYHDREDGTRERLPEVALDDGTQYLIDAEGLAAVLAMRPDLGGVDWAGYDSNGQDE